jgi:predicted DNA-binding transcriptional regulator YafY
MRLPDGSLEWRAQIGDATEILPWVLGWGATVEVLAPSALREAVAAEYRAAAARYR